MAGFRGIGDSATQVKMQQDQQKLQAAQISESARQADLGRISQAQARAQQASQFDKSQAQQASQFDTAQSAAADKDAWQRDFAERTAVTESGLNERKMNLADFGARLNAMVSDAEVTGKDAETRLRLAQLNQYVAATADEDRRRKNRETLAKGSFGSLAISAMMNGGVMPVSAIELANREIGDPDNRVVGGGTDPETGIAFFNIAKKDGTQTQLKMSPENQYGLLQEVYGDAIASEFAANYKNNAAVNAAIERARAAAAAKSTPDPVKAANAMTAVGQAKVKAADATFDMAEKKRLVAEGTKTISEAENMLRGTTPGAAGRPTAAPEVSDADISAAGVPPGYRKQIDPATGDTVVYWRENGKMMSAKFPAGGQKKKGPSAASQVISVMGALP